MATERSVTELDSLLADNISGNIGAVDVRDLRASAMGGYASLEMTPWPTPKLLEGVQKSFSGGWDKVDVFDQAIAQSVDVNTGGCQAVPASNHIVIGKSGIYAVAFSMTYNIVNTVPWDLVQFVVGVNGSPTSREIRSRGDTNYTFSVSAIFRMPLTAGDLVTLLWKRATIGDVKIQTATLSVDRSG